MFFGMACFFELLPCPSRMNGLGFRAFGVSTLTLSLSLLFYGLGFLGLWGFGDAILEGSRDEARRAY